MLLSPSGSSACETRNGTQQTAPKCGSVCWVGSARSGRSKHVPGDPNQTWVHDPFIFGNDQFNKNKQIPKTRDNSRGSFQPFFSGILISRKPPKTPRGKWRSVCHARFVRSKTAGALGTRSPTTDLGGGSDLFGGGGTCLIAAPARPNHPPPPPPKKKHQTLSLDSFGPGKPQLLGGAGLFDARMAQKGVKRVVQYLLRSDRRNQQPFSFCAGSRQTHGNPHETNQETKGAAKSTVKSFHVVSSKTTQKQPASSAARGSAAHGFGCLAESSERLVAPRKGRTIRRYGEVGWFALSPRAENVLVVFVKLKACRKRGNVLCLKNRLVLGVAFDILWRVCQRPAFSGSLKLEGRFRNFGKWSIQRFAVQNLIPLSFEKPPLLATAFREGMSGADLQRCNKSGRYDKKR